MFKEFGGANKNLIDKYEKLIKMKLPKDYKDFLLKTNGGIFEETIPLFMIDQVCEEIGVEVLFGLQNAEGLDLESWFSEYQDELVEYVAVIGDTWGVGLILLICQDDIKGIFLWDHCLELEQSTEEDCLYKIADDFETFFKMLK